MKVKRISEVIKEKIVFLEGVVNLLEDSGDYLGDPESDASEKQITYIQRLVTATEILSNAQKEWLC